jgi:hypothetical protein
MVPGTIGPQVSFPAPAALLRRAPPARSISRSPPKKAPQPTDMPASVAPGVLVKTG